MPIAPLSHLDLARGSARVRKRKTNSSVGGSAAPSALPQLSRREGIARRDFSRALARPFFHSPVRGDPGDPRPRRLPDLTTRSLVYRPGARGEARPVVSRPVINKSIALLSHSGGALHLRHFHNRTRGRAGRCERETTEEAGRKKGEERCFPPSRIGKSVLLRSPLRSSSAARSERLFLLETRSRRADRRAACARHVVFSLSLFRLIYVPIYLLSLASCSCAASDVPIGERDTRVNKTDSDEAANFKLTVTILFRFRSNSMRFL